MGEESGEAAAGRAPELIFKGQDIKLPKIWVEPHCQRLTLV